MVMDKLVHYRCIDPAHEAKPGAGRYTIHNGDWGYCVAGGTSGSHQWLRLPAPSDASVLRVRVSTRDR